MTDYAACHIRTSRAGSFYYAQPRDSGVMRVYYDSKLYEYKIPYARGRCREIKQWIEDVFNSRVTGKYPNYYAES